MEKIDKSRETVSAMFDSIASSYDFLNHFLSLGIDRLWRKRAVRLIRKYYSAPKILDVATGTGDLALAAIKANPSHITGIDISEAMLEEGRKKIARSGLEPVIDLMPGASEEINFSTGSFDVVMVAFGVRNFSDMNRGLSEMARVASRGGMLLILEFSKPRVFPLKQLYGFYFLKVLPVIGRIFSRNYSAYRYLPETVMSFPDNEDFMLILRNLGLTDVKQIRLTGGIASIYYGFKA